jgi:hypothetical protein
MMSRVFGFFTIGRRRQCCGLFDRIEREPEDTCLYKRVKLDYTYGLNKIYTEAEIENAKHSPSFKRSSSRSNVLSM